MKKAPPKPLPYPFYFWQVFGYTLAGLLTSLFLAYTHYKNHTDIAYSSFCAITQAINCDTVAQSPWSIFWGLPVAIWGVFAYMFILLLLIPLRQLNNRKANCWSLITIVAVLAVCCSLVLAFISFTRIHSWCMLCVATYAINFLLVFTAWITCRRFSKSGFFAALSSALSIVAQSTAIKIGLPLLIAALISLRFILPSYWLPKMEAVDIKVATGVTEQGYPWIGAQAPRFVIEEFTDYQCFQCKKMHQYLRQLINQYPERVRLVHRHYPLDHEFNRIIAPSPFHVGSGRLALIAVVAAKHNAFWIVNDALYEAVQTKTDSIAIEAFAQMMGISAEQLAREMLSEKSLKHLQHDMVQGLQHGITGTPAFVIDGVLYEKTIPPDLLKEMFK